MKFQGLWYRMVLAVYGGGYAVYGGGAGRASTVLQTEVLEELAVVSHAMHQKMMRRIPVPSAIPATALESYD